MKKKDQRRTQVIRVFSDQLKQKIVRDFESGKFTVRELADLYHVSQQSVYKWLYRFSPAHKPKLRVVEMPRSQSKQIKELKAQISELQRKVGQKQIQIDLLEQILKEANSELGMDLKKSTCTKP